MNISQVTSNFGGRSVTRFCRLSALGAALVFLAGYGGQYDDGGGAVAADKICKKMVPGVTKRLTVSNQDLLDPDTGCPVILRGANLRDNLRDDDGTQVTDVPLVTDTEVNDMVNLGFNFVRLRISREGANLYTGEPPNESGLTQKTEEAITKAVDLLSAKKIWILLEMRTDDATANNSPLYDTSANPGTGTDTYQQYQKTWVWLAKTFHQTNYIAGYGLLAEPSPDKAPVWPDVNGIKECRDAKLTYPVCALIGFQAGLMKAISAVDPRTPFFVGPAYNYSTMGYRWDAYFKDPRLKTYADAHRLIYEVNMLSPKSWIADAEIPPESCAQFWPTGKQQCKGKKIDFPALVTVNTLGGESCDANLNVPRSKPLRPCPQAEDIFKTNSNIPDNFYMLMSADYPKWYLGFASQFAKRNKVPMVVDQFGATICVDKKPNQPCSNTALQATEQQQQYEQKLIDAAEGFDMGWARWIYSAKPPGKPTDYRSIVGNERVHKFYLDLACDNKTNDPALCTKRK